MRLALCAPILFGAAVLQAGTFDEWIVAPPALGAAAFKVRVKDYFAAYERLQSATDDSPGAQIRDRTEHDRWSGLQWRLARALDEQKPLGDLSEFGLISREDGSYSVRLKDYPQWAPLDSLLTVLRDPAVFESYATQLQARGFRDSDLEVMKEYVEKNNPQRAAFTANKPLIEMFGVVPDRFLGRDGPWSRPALAKR